MATSYASNTQRSIGRPLPPKPLVAPEIRELEARIVEASRWVAPLRHEIGTVIVGQHALVDRLLFALLTGLAKTLALKTLAGSIEGARFGPIQFTPDMLFVANFVLADEINRAPAKVQSARHGLPPGTAATSSPKTSRASLPTSSVTALR